MHVFTEAGMYINGDTTPPTICVHPKGSVEDKAMRKAWRYDRTPRSAAAIEKAMQ